MSYADYLPYRVPTLSKFICERIEKIGMRTYFPVMFDRDNDLLSCFGMEIYIPDSKLLGGLRGDVDEFDSDALDVRVRLKRL